MFKKVTDVYYRSGLSYAQVVIDGYLNDDDGCQALYTTWRAHPDWPEMLEFQGGIRAITADAILEVPQDEFVEALAQVMKERSRQDGGKADPIACCRGRAAAIYDIAKKNAG